MIVPGIGEWDRGNRHKAIELYHRALTIYPKNPWTLYEISLDYCTHDQSGQLIWNEKVEPYYSLIRFLDPLFMSAYQGQLTPELRKAELALYAYKYLLFHTYQGGFDQELITQMSSCFTELKMNQVIDFLGEFLDKMEKIYGSKR